MKMLLVRNKYIYPSGLFLNEKESKVLYTVHFLHLICY